MSHPDTAPTHASDLDRLRADIWNARYGDPRFGHEDFAAFGSLIARADEIGDPYWRFVARLEAATAAAWDGGLADQLTLGVWMMRFLDKHENELALTSDRYLALHRILAELVESITGLPEVSLDQADAIVADWERRVDGTGFASTAHAACSRAQILWHRGDRERALGLLDGITDFRSPAHMCDRGTRSLVATLYAQWGVHERAIAVAEADLVDDGTGCNFFPGESYMGLVESYAQLGRRDDALRGVTELERNYGDLPHSESLTTAMIVLLRLNELDHARRIAMERLTCLDSVATPHDRARRAAALSAVLAAVAASDPDAVITTGDPSGRGSAVRSTADVAADLARTARETARAFDVRNANSMVTEQIEGILALSAVGAPAARLTPIAERTAIELLSGFSAFSSVSDRRASACLDALATKADELTGVDRARMQVVFASNLRRTDPAASVEAMREVAASIRSEFPGMAAQTALMADLTAAELGTVDSPALSDIADPAPSWSAISQAAYLRIVAAAVGGTDPERAEAAIARALDVLAAADRGELPLSDGVSASTRDRRVDVEAMRVALHLLAASLLLSRERPADEAVNAALLAARQMVRTATHPDQVLESQAELAEALSFAARVQSAQDLRAARHLLDEAVEHARYSQRGAMLQQRAELAVAMDRLNDAVDDHEQAVAVWTVDGAAHAADGAMLDSAHVRLLREDDPRDVIDAVRPVITRMDERGDTRSAMIGWQVLGRAQVAAGLPADAVTSFTTVLQLMAGDEHPGYVAQVRQGRAGELMDLERYAEAVDDLGVAADLYTRIGALFEVGDAYRTAALAAYFGGDGVAASNYLQKAADVYDALDGDPDSAEQVAYKRVRLELARAEIVRHDDPPQAAAILAAAIDRAVAGQWTDLEITGLHLAALVELVSDDDAARERARTLVERGLDLDPDHAGLLDLDDYLDDF
ncbi:hypothetical protein [Gordonia hydrophobica]|uniref:Tetratricopeptide repeat protein n=1 Tax=Gordonia hydrophobica TaxID=40516 RepID=A0ABZ2U6W4_9ACTN|nr:hypothetical protein [Gordonia hydrophobica]MBM7365664.1 tetratricopeptide (TPR) repeat protein [Gordonia hydrophobica]